ncbi:MAG TPA: GNAT family N-acetyltransferase [Acidimicrobiales bacterium]|nr:GNAT family N-acetyltransferase [Acidimicrobiales bacterium]
MQSPVRFRRYSESDLEQVMALCASEGWTSYTEDRIRVHSVFTAPGVVSVVGESDGEVISFAYCQTDGAIQAHLSLIVVTPNHRRKGIARGLLTFAFDYLGAGRIDLITDSAQDFYRSLPHKEHFGFRIYPTGE